MSALPIIIIGLGVIVLVLVIAFRSQERAKAGSENNWTNDRHLSRRDGTAAPNDYPAGSASVTDGGDSGDGGGGGD